MHVIIYIGSCCVSVIYGGNRFDLPVLSGIGGFVAGVAVAVLVATLIIVIRLDNYSQYFILILFNMTFV